MPYFRTHLTADKIHLVEIGINCPEDHTLCGRDLAAFKWFNIWLHDKRRFAARLDELPYREHKKICKSCARINAD